MKLFNFLGRDITEELSVGEDINILETMAILNGISESSQYILGKAGNTLSCGNLVSLKMVEVLASSTVPLEKVRLLVLNLTLR
jgi:hypothetical protein